MFYVLLMLFAPLSSFPLPSLFLFIHVLGGNVNKCPLLWLDSFVVSRPWQESSIYCHFMKSSFYTTQLACTLDTTNTNCKVSDREPQNTTHNTHNSISNTWTSAFLLSYYSRKTSQHRLHSTLWIIIIIIIKRALIHSAKCTLIRYKNHLLLASSTTLTQWMIIMTKTWKECIYLVLPLLWMMQYTMIAR